MAGLGRFLGDPIYVRIHRDALWMREIGSGNEMREPPLAALSDSPRRLLAIGREAAALRGKPGVIVLNPFSHPRSPFSDFTVAEVLLKAFLRKLRGGRKFLMPAPRMVMSLDGPEPEGGLTQIELRVMKELGVGAGASKVDVWIGPPLSDEQVLRRSFPTTGEVH